MKTETQTWTIWKMPKKLKREFVGMVKLRGKEVADVVADLARKWLEKEKRKGV